MGKPEISGSERKRGDRKRELVMACTTDRIAWVAAYRRRPPESPVRRVAASVLNHLGPVTEFLPGRLGKWARRTSLLARVGRQLGLFKR